MGIKQWGLQISKWGHSLTGAVCAKFQSRIDARAEAPRGVGEGIRDGVPLGPSPLEVRSGEGLFPFPENKLDFGSQIGGANWVIFVHRKYNK